MCVGVVVVVVACRPSPVRWSMKVGAGWRGLRMLSMVNTLDELRSGKDAPQNIARDGSEEQSAQQGGLLCQRYGQALSLSAFHLKLLLRESAGQPGPCWRSSTLSARIVRRGYYGIGST